MTNTELLRAKIKDSGMTVVSIAEKMGITRETLYNRLAGSDFRVSEVRALEKILRLSEEERNIIFFS